MDKALVSIVVPIFKVEQYLEECIDSILNQTYENLQIILVDDGSPDRCPEIADFYKGIDERVCVIHKENGGLSSARNSGIEIAKGEYIAFVDSDDVLGCTYVERLLEIIAIDGADIAVCAFDTFENSVSVLNNSGSEETIVFNNEQAIFEMYKNNSIGWNAWNKLYKTFLFGDVRYPDGVICEDKATTYKLLLKANRISYTKEQLYHYRVRNNSISGEHSIKFCLDSIMINNEMEKDFEANRLDYAIKLAKSYSAKCAFILYSDAINRDGYYEVREKCLQELSEKYRYIRFAKYLRSSEKVLIYLAGISAKNRYRLVLYLLCRVTNYMRNRRV